MTEKTVDPPTPTLPPAVKTSSGVGRVVSALLIIAVLLAALGAAFYQFGWPGSAINGSVWPRLNSRSQTSRDRSSKPLTGRTSSLR